MGFLKNSIIAATLLSYLAQAAPAPRAIKARDYYTDIVTETVWTTVDVTTTVYVDELSSTTPASTTAEVTSSKKAPKASYTPPPAPSAPSVPAPAPSAPKAESSAPPLSKAAPAASSSAAGGEFAESSAAPSPPAYTPPPAPSAPAYTPPAPAPAAPAPSSAPAPAPAAPSAAPKQGAADSGSAASESGTCENGSKCLGDVTHYDGGLGACGTNVDTEGEMAIALPFGFMGTASNSNPYCGKSVTVHNPVSGTTVQGVVKDKCMGCVGRAIDLTNKMFNAVTDGKGDGRVHGIEWWFN
jgi:hypothetical protein